MPSSEDKHARGRMRGYPRARRPRPSAPRIGARVLAIGLSLAMPAVALAAQPVADATPTGPEVKLAAAESKVVEVERAVARTEPDLPVRRAVAAEAEALADSSAALTGPFHPLDAPPDYGEAEAAFGNARGRPHEGQDVFAPAGTAILAPTEGEVVDGGSDGGRGNWLSIYDPAREQSYSFFHMNGPALVAKGERVRAGQRIGEVGCTGSCYGDHLHFELREGRGPYGEALDPLPLLERWQRFPG